MKKVMTALAVLTLAFGLAVSAPQQAEARRGGAIFAGVAAGLIGAAILSNAYGHGYRSYHRPYYYGAYSSGPYYGGYYAPRRHYVRRVYRPVQYRWGPHRAYHRAWHRW